MLLEVRDVSKVFGGLWAVRGYSLRLEAGTIHGLIGPNGAGKTTLFNLITGLLRVTSGAILFQGTDITRWRPDQRARIGVTRSFQNLRLFRRLSVAQNLQIARHMHLDYRLPSALLGLPGYRKQERELEGFGEDLLALFGLADCRDRPAGELPYGLQRKLDIARTVATGAQLILLDEPTAGMNSFEAEGLAGLLKEVWRRYRLTLIIVEHRMPFILGLAGRIQVLDHGVTIAAGSPGEVRQDPRVIEAYLGKDEDDA